MPVDQLQQLLNSHHLSEKQKYWCEDAIKEIKAGRVEPSTWLIIDDKSKVEQEEVMNNYSNKHSGEVEWEALRSTGEGPQYIRRAKVFGGWLVETSSMSTGAGGLTFMPDPGHQWAP
jgi:hypothetical protein